MAASAREGHPLLSLSLESALVRPRGGQVHFLNGFNRRHNPNDNDGEIELRKLTCAKVLIEAAERHLGRTLKPVVIRIAGITVDHVKRISMSRFS